MIRNITKNSIFAREVFAFFYSFHRMWRFSALRALTEGLKVQYESSVSRRAWEGFCSVPDTVDMSLYGRALNRVRKGIEKIGSLLLHSFLYKILSRFKLGLNKWFIVAFVLYLPLEYVIRNRLSIPLIASLWEEVFILLTFVLVLWRRALKRNNAPGKETPLDAYILLYISVGFLLMSLVSPWPAVALAGYRAAVEYMVWFFLIVRLIESKRDFNIAYYSFLILGTLLCLHGIYQYIVAVPIPASWITNTEMGVRTRVFSIIGSPNLFGSLIVMIAPMAAAMIYYCKRIWMKMLFTAVTGIMCLCLLFTFSRGAWVGIVVAVVIFSLYLDRRLLGALGGFMALVLVLIPSIASRLTYLFTSDYREASALGGRTLRWELGRLLLTENNPWLGFGLGRFGGAVAMNNKVLVETDTFRYFYMDNYYLKTMVEMGYVGLFFLLLMMVGLVIWGLRAIYQSSDICETKNDPLFRAVGKERAMAVGIFSGLMGVLAHCYFENIFEEPFMMAYFFGLASMLMYLGFKNVSPPAQ